MTKAKTTIEIAKECGLPLEEEVAFGKYESIVPNLDLFRKACIAEYKSRCKQVAWMNDKTPSGIFARYKEGADNFGCDILLFTLPDAGFSVEVIK